MTINTMQTFANRYFVCLSHAPLDPISWDDFGEAHFAVDQIYFGKVFETMERQLTVKRMTFYLTWNTEQLPSYGDNVIAIVLGDEFCRFPSYSHRVRAVFKTYSMSPIIGCNLLFKPSYLNIMTFTQFLRMLIIRTPGFLKYYFYKLKGVKVAPIYEIPMGYYNQENLPIKPIEKRRYDLFFAGSLVLDSYSFWSRRKWFRNSKDIARKEMLSSIENLQKRYPQLKIAVGTSHHFGLEAKTSKDNRSYSEKLMDSKICLAPRGSSFETFRFFEGLRYGCIIVVEALPDCSYYKNSPAISLLSWSELESKIKQLIQDLELIKSKHEASLQWWQEKCSEATVGSYMAKRINAQD
ncbi:glycosyltransferase family 47 protein [Pleurocapsa sp. FMAR1]|uniref:hypothetical protein n=1 Tax=Pleurocapsa sp. FMAR1 TaxID=3040204 RepID=UPI0029C61195|nr:hypothetical protein [Pleurocapsa sp. FMAR1]